jgi:hypothetical protein
MQMSTWTRDRINGTESLSHGKSSPPLERSTVKSTRMHRWYWTQYSKNKIQHVKGRKAELITFPFSFFISVLFFLLLFFCNVQCSLFEARCCNTLETYSVFCILSVFHYESQFHKFNQRSKIRSTCLLVWNSNIRTALSGQVPRAHRF